MYCFEVSLGAPRICSGRLTLLSSFLSSLLPLLFSFRSFAARSVSGVGSGITGPSDDSIAFCLCLSTLRFSGNAEWGRFYMSFPSKGTGSESSSSLVIACRCDPPVLYLLWFVENDGRRLFKADLYPVRNGQDRHGAPYALHRAHSHESDEIFTTICFVHSLLCCDSVGTLFSSVQLGRSCQTTTSATVEEGGPILGRRRCRRRRFSHPDFCVCFFAVSPLRVSRIASSSSLRRRSIRAQF